MISLSLNKSVIQERDVMRKRENALQMQDAAKMGTTPNDN